ncbi:SusD/RagB family nutrient-binding outer membrane lipoprotein [Flammeovirga agarivorans]|uniref:SusD/RagB family nutrient-binding outer membrane lipoprotein n=1 Tax=Flammeovirga agarivorans TaxID=2726742 RepID=A0A7X8SL86_9BACT|nr:SusD/RagB family nutrient-binding outer membrane lipoprotein [Flammeovirga agarivorans]NLR92293.1 SusD/RagB family nutrient-binding outer membrane lipoprotein [Flammeovirga agarivorans]
MKKLLIYAASLMISLGTTSCFKDFDDMQVNPNYPSEVNPGNLFANATFSRIGGIYGVQAEDFNMTASGLWAQQFAKIQYIDEDWYEYRSGAIDGYWKYMLSGSSTNGSASMYDLELALHSVRNTKEELLASDPAYDVADLEAMEGAILVMRSYFFSVMTDVWGDIPYSEAFKTVALGYEKTITQPKYDAQKDIYDDLFVQLETANELLAGGGNVESQADMIYGGDAKKWQKFANSLAARLYIHISKVDQGKAQEGLTKIFSNAGKYPVFTSVEDDAMLTYSGSQPYEHPFFENYVRDARDDHSSSKTMIDMLKARKDTRMYIYATPTPASITVFDSTGNAADIQYVGQENGVPKSEDFKLAERSRIGVLYRVTPNGVSHVMSYSELEFIKAEAAAVLGIGAAGDPQTAYNNGIRASFERQYLLADNYGIKTASFGEQNGSISFAESKVIEEDGYEVEIAYSNVDEHYNRTIAQPNVAWDAGKAAQLIAEQKFISLFTNGPEVFTEVRRTNFPQLTFVRGGTQYKGLGLPFRFPYAISEQTANAANWSEAATGITNTMYGKTVWWNTAEFDNYRVIE